MVISCRSGANSLVSSVGRDLNYEQIGLILGPPIHINDALRIQMKINGASRRGLGTLFM